MAVNIRLLALSCCIIFNIASVSFVKADSVDDEDKEMQEFNNPWRRKERPKSFWLKNLLFTDERNIATADRKLRNSERTRVTNILIKTTSGYVSNRRDMLKLWRLRDKDAFKLVERWENNPKEIDDREVIAWDVHHSDFVKRLMGDKAELRKRLENPEQYEAYKYEPYWHLPETMVFSNSQEYIQFSISDDDGFRERIVPILWELNDSNSLSILSGMAVNDKSEKVRNKAAEAWLALLMPEGLTEDQKLMLLDNYIVPHMKRLTNDQKAWLDNFIKSETLRGKDGKKWAIEAAGRVLNKMEKGRDSVEATVVGTNNSPERK